MSAMGRFIKCCSGVNLVRIGVTWEKIHVSCSSRRSLGRPQMYLWQLESRIRLSPRCCTFGRLQDPKMNGWNSCGSYGCIVAFIYHKAYLRSSCHKNESSKLRCEDGKSVAKTSSVVGEKYNRPQRYRHSCEVEPAMLLVRKRKNKVARPRLFVSWIPQLMQVTLWVGRKRMRVGFGGLLVYQIHATCSCHHTRLDLLMAVHKSFETLLNCLNSKMHLKI